MASLHLSPHPHYKHTRGQRVCRHYSHRHSLSFNHTVCVRESCLVSSSTSRGAAKVYRHSWKSNKAVAPFIPWGQRGGRTRSLCFFKIMKSNHSLPEIYSQCHCHDVPFWCHRGLHKFLFQGHTLRKSTSEINKVKRYQLYNNRSCIRTCERTSLRCCWTTTHSQDNDLCYILNDIIYYYIAFL